MANAPKTPTAPRLLTLEEAAAVLQCHRTTIGRLVAQGDLACIRYSDRPGARMLFTMDLLTEFLQRRAARKPPVLARPRATAAASRRRPNTAHAPASPWEEPSSRTEQLW